MNRPWKCVLIAAFVSIGASAQTAVTTSGGTTYNIPVFNGAASLGASPIYASGNNVGIGTTAPMTALQVMGSISAQGPGGDPSFVLYKGDGGAANLYSGIANTGTNGFNRLSFFTNNAPQFGGSTENMVVLNSGAVGIGTTIPNARFHIVDPNGTVIGTSSTNGFGNGNVIIQSKYGARTPGTGAALTFALPANTDGSNPAEQVRIVGTPDSSGNGDAHGRMYLQTRTMNQAGNAWIWNNNLLLTSDGSVALGGSLKFADGSTQTTAFNPAAISGSLNVAVPSGTGQGTIAAFTNGTNNAYTAIAGAGNASVVPTWVNGSQILEFVPAASGNGVISTYTGNLLFQTSQRTNQMAILASGNVGIGTVTPAEKLEVSGNIKLTSSSGAHIVFPDGSQQSVAWTGVLSGGDYAESVDISRMRDSLEPGDLITIDEEQNGRFVKSTTAYSPLVSGVYATKPGVIGRRQRRTKSQEDEVPMAMVGIVPTKVSTENGPIRRGDLLVSSSTPGYAMKGTDRDKLTGAVLGKALETLDSGKGVIEVLISLQ